QLRTLEGVGNPTGMIIGGLATGREGKEANAPNNIFNISYRGPVAEECEVIVKSVIESYRDYLGATYDRVSREILKAIEDANEIQVKQLDELQKEYQKFRENPDATEIWRGKDGTLLQHARIADLEIKVGGVRSRYEEVKERLRRLEAARKEGKDPAELLS